MQPQHLNYGQRGQQLHMHNISNGGWVLLFWVFFFPIHTFSCWKEHHLPQLRAEMRFNIFLKTIFLKNLKQLSDFNSNRPEPCLPFSRCWFTATHGVPNSALAARWPLIYRVHPEHRAHAHWAAVSNAYLKLCTTTTDFRYSSHHSRSETSSLSLSFKTSLQSPELMPFNASKHQQPSLKKALQFLKPKHAWL